jgi:cysteinyl-tRNA synthetase
VAKRKKPKQLLFFAISRSANAKKKRRKKPVPKKKATRSKKRTFHVLTSDNVDFDKLDKESQQYVQSLVEQRKREVQNRWNSEDELRRRLGHSLPNLRDYTLTDDGRYVENVQVFSELSDELDSHDDD